VLDRSFIRGTAVNEQKGWLSEEGDEAQICNLTMHAHFSPDVRQTTHYRLLSPTKERNENLHSNTAIIEPP
jgi:hypothetical protein